MKSFRLFAMFAVAAMLVVASCKKEDPAATCSDGIQNQGETGIDCGGPCQACREGIHGKWKSFPVAPILANFADSIIAEFKTNSTYVVEQWKDGAKITLTGTFIQTKASTSTIWDITVNQTSPTVLTAAGIFEVAADGKTMKYEVAQINPPIQGVTPPSASAGFGSTSGGAFGVLNVQNYVRIN
ncbi:MAG: hypothetical protein IPM26_02470 [Saprospiraceae bacterium]|nr:hypothetical protein [Saprospiraceae bacterium]